MVDHETSSLANRELADFTTHTLQDIERVRLMNRVDSKFLLNRALVPSLFRKVKKLCSVLKVNNSLLTEYYNIYFDDSTLGLYHQHHRGKSNRHKVRYRSYGQQGLSFLEVKFKNNKNRTVKTRMMIERDQIEQRFLDYEFLSHNGLHNARDLTAIQCCDYTRVALASENNVERMTVDFDLRFNNLNSGREIDVPELVIVELKQARLNRSSALYKVLKSFHTRPESCSKYCLGLALDNKQSSKYNLFKPTLRRVSDLSGVILNE